MPTTSPRRPALTRKAQGPGSPTKGAPRKSNKLGWNKKAQALLDSTNDSEADDSDLWSNSSKEGNDSSGDESKEEKDSSSEDEDYNHSDDEESESEEDEEDVESISGDSFPGSKGSCGGNDLDPLLELEGSDEENVEVQEGCGNFTRSGTW